MMHEVVQSAYDYPRVWVGGIKKKFFPSLSRNLAEMGMSQSAQPNM